MNRADQTSFTRFLEQPTRFLFFTGKGGVGKTSLACATAIALADRGLRVLLVSTDPASNLDEVLGVALGSEPRVIPGVPRLAALNIDPAAAARAYRERLVGPYRAKLPEAVVRSMEEQLSGACTMEIAAFDEFARLLGEPAATVEYDHVIFDTAPTGHTLRLLSLPGAWKGFLDTNTSGASCLGPLAGLRKQRSLYQGSVAALGDGRRTTLVLVSRPQKGALDEAERTSKELAAIGVLNQRLVLNGMFHASNPEDAIAVAFEKRGARALRDKAEFLATVPLTEVPLRTRNLLGLATLRALAGNAERLPSASENPTPGLPSTESLSSLVDALVESGPGVIMTMGKGGVGKTTIAAAIATELARTRVARPPEHHGPGGPRGRHGRSRRRLGSQPYRPAGRDQGLRRPGDEHGGQRPRCRRPRDARGGFALALHGRNRRVSRLRPHRGPGPEPFCGPRHRAHRTHPVAARRDRGLPPGSRPQGQRHAGGSPATSCPGSATPASPTSSS